MSFYKDTEKIVLLHVKDLIRIIVKTRAEENSMHVSVMHQLFFWGTLNIVHKNICVVKPALKRNELKVYISLNGNKLTLLQKAKNFYQEHDLVHDIWKNYRERHISSPWCTHDPNVWTKHTTKNYVPSFLIPSALKTFM